MASLTWAGLWKTKDLAENTVDRSCVRLAVAICVEGNKGVFSGSDEIRPLSDLDGFRFVGGALKISTLLCEYLLLIGSLGCKRLDKVPPGLLLALPPPPSLSDEELWNLKTVVISRQPSDDLPLLLSCRTGGCARTF